MFKYYLRSCDNCTAVKSEFHICQHLFSVGAKNKKTFLLSINNKQEKRKKNKFNETFIFDLVLV